MDINSASVHPGKFLNLPFRDVNTHGPIGITSVLGLARLLLSPPREAGSSKFGAFVAVSTCMSAVLQWAAQRNGFGLPPVPSGPYGLIFACLVQYYWQVPPSNKIVLLGWRVSDKVSKRADRDAGEVRWGCS